MVARPDQMKLCKEYIDKYKDIPKYSWLHTYGKPGFKLGLGNYYFLVTKEQVEGIQELFYLELENIEVERQAVIDEKTEQGLNGAFYLVE